MANSCALARAKLVDAVASLRKAGTREKITTGIKAGFVTSIVTPMRAVAGNASWGGVVHLARNPLASAIDVVQATGRSAATGFKVKPHEFRDFVNTLDRDGMKVMARGFKKGTEPVREAATAARGADRPVSKFINELRQRLNANPNVPNTTVEYKRTVYKHPLAQTMTDGAFAILEAADRPWWQMAFDTSIYQQSKLLAVREGLKGKNLRARSAELQATPTLEMQMRALDDANYATFKDKNVLSTTAANIKRGIKNVADKKTDPTLGPWRRAQAESLKAAAKVGDYVAEATLPFTGVPSSVAGKMVSTSPLGLLNPDLLKGTAGQRAQALANAGIGFGMVAIGMELYEKGLITGALPKSKTERDQWTEAKRPSFSIKIGDNWYGLRSLGPAAASLFMGAALRRGFDEGETPTDAISQGAGESAKFLTQQTYLAQIGAMVEAMQGEPGRGARVAANLALPTPAFIGQLNRAADPYERDTREFGDQLKSKLPLGHLYAPTPRRMGVTGPLPKRTAAERISSVASPLPITRSRDDATLRELRRLGVSFGIPPKQVKGGGKVADLPREQWEQLTTEAGGGAMAEIRRILQDPTFQALDDEEKKKVLDQVVEDYRSNVRDPMKEALLAAAAPRKKKVRR